MHLPGRRLGVYEVHEQIGADGMGEVYRARDARLGRDVAIKIFQNRETPPQEWITVYERSGAERSAGVSPDGSLLYLLLERDGFRCLYAVRVDPETGKPAGEEPFLVHHFHDASRQWGSTGFGSATVTGMFLVELYETTGTSG